MYRSAQCALFLPRVKPGNAVLYNSATFRAYLMMETNTEVADARQTERDFVGALEKGLAVIEAFNANDVALTPAVVADKTGLTRAGARRYLLTLAKLGYAEFDGKFFRLTPRVLRL